MRGAEGIVRQPVAESREIQRPKLVTTIARQITIHTHLLCQLVEHARADCRRVCPQQVLLRLTKCPVVTVSTTKRRKHSADLSK